MRGYVTRLKTAPFEPSGRRRTRRVVAGLPTHAFGRSSEAGRAQLRRFFPSTRDAVGSRMSVQRCRQTELRAARRVGGAEDAVRVDEGRRRVAAQQQSRLREHRIGYLTVRSNMSHAEGVAAQISRQSGGPTRDPRAKALAEIDLGSRRVSEASIWPKTGRDRVGWGHPIRKAAKAAPGGRKTAPARIWRAFTAPAARRSSSRSPATVM
jgi:hypothetical protein